MDDLTTLKQLVTRLAMALWITDQATVFDAMPGKVLVTDGRNVKSFYASEAAGESALELAYQYFKAQCVAKLGALWIEADQ